MSATVNRSVIQSCNEDLGAKEVALPYFRLRWRLFYPHSAQASPREVTVETVSGQLLVGKSIFSTFHGIIISRSTRWCNTVQKVTNNV